MNWPRLSTRVATLLFYPQTQCRHDRGLRGCRANTEGEGTNTGSSASCEWRRLSFSPGRLLFISCASPLPGPPCRRSHLVFDGCQRVRTIFVPRILPHLLCALRFLRPLAPLLVQALWTWPGLGLRPATTCAHVGWRPPSAECRLQAAGHSVDRNEMHPDAVGV